MADEKTVEKMSGSSDIELLKAVSTENDTPEQLQAAAEIMAKQREDAERTILTNPSYVALSTAPPVVSEQQTINKVRKRVRELFILYLTNQFVARAINVRAETLVSKGYNIVKGSEAGRKACEELVKNSGGINLFWQLSVNTDIAGDGFLEIIPNTKKNKLMRLKHVHPLTLFFRRDSNDNIIIDKTSKLPVGYEQVTYDADGMEIKKKIAKEKIAHIRYNTLGDEFTGVSTIQPGYNTIVRLMNMEYSAAEAALRTANPLIVAECNTKSPVQIAQWAQILGRISGREQVLVPEGMKLTMLSPGNQNFSEYSDYFLNAVVSTFGVPKAVLLGEGENSNRSEGIILSRHFYTLIQGNQKYMEDFFNEIFALYGKIAGFEAPELEFPDIAEDAQLSAKAAIDLFAAGILTLNEARSMIGLDPLKNGGNIKDGSDINVSTVAEEIKKSDRAVQFPAEPGKAEGSQAGVKDAAKNDPLQNIGKKPE